MAADEYLAEMDTELFIEAVWHRRYLPSLPELRRLIGAFDMLDSQAMMVLSERFRAPDGQTLREVGEKLGRTRERVRQIEDAAIKEIRRAVGAPVEREDRRIAAHRPGGGAVGDD